MYECRYACMHRPSTHTHTTHTHTHTHTHQMPATPASDLPVISSKKVPVLRLVLQPLKISVWVYTPFVVGRRLSQLFKVMARICSETALGNYWVVPSRPYRTHTHTTGSKLRCQTQTKHTTKYLWNTTIPVKHSSVLPDDGSHKIRNLSEWFLILCLLNFYTT
jgi:hypothetical protein